MQEKSCLSVYRRMYARTTFCLKLTFLFSALHQYSVVIHFSTSTTKQDAPTAPTFLFHSHVSAEPRRARLRVRSRPRYAGPSAPAQLGRPQPALRQRPRLLRLRAASVLSKPDGAECGARRRLRTAWRQRWRRVFHRNDESVQQPSAALAGRSAPAARRLGWCAAIRRPARRLGAQCAFRFR